MIELEWNLIPVRADTDMFAAVLPILYFNGRSGCEVR